MRLSKIEWESPWYVITLSEDGQISDVIFTGNEEQAIDLANEWENKVD
jgi:hypothetical protein